MARDRNGWRLIVGDNVRIIDGMTLRVDRRTYLGGRIVKIDGTDVYVGIKVGEQTVTCHLYPTELWRGDHIGDEGHDDNSLTAVILRNKEKDEADRKAGR